MIRCAARTHSGPIPSPGISVTRRRPSGPACASNGGAPLLASCGSAVRPLMATTRRRPVGSFDLPTGSRPPLVRPRTVPARCSRVSRCRPGRGGVHVAADPPAALGQPAAARVRRPRPSAAVDRRSRQGIEQHPAPHLHRAGEPLVRSLLRDLPRRGRDPDEARRPTVCVPDPVTRALRRSRTTTATLVQYRWAARPARTRVSDVARRARWTGSSRRSCRRPNPCADRRATRLPSARAIVGPQGQPDVMGYHTAQRDPELLGVRRERSCSRTTCSRPADSWTLPAHLFLVSAWSATLQQPARPDDVPLRPRAAERRGRQPAPRAFPPRVYGWTDITYLLHEHDVSWAYYVGDDTCVRPCPSQRATTGPPPAQNPLPGFTTVSQRPPARQHPTHGDYCAGGCRRHAAVGVLDHAGRGAPSEHPGTGEPISDGHGLRHGRRQRRDAGARTGTRRRSSSRGTTGAGSTTTCAPIRVDENGYGIRVPGILISPWAKRGTIDQQTLSFDAYLKLIEDRFLGGQRLDPEDRRPARSAPDRARGGAGSSGTCERSSTSRRLRCRR